MRRVFELISQRPWSAAVWILIAGLFILGAGGLSVVLSCSSSRFYPSSATSAGLSAIRFEPNVGQTEGNFRYLAHGSGHWIYLTSSEAVFELRGTHRFAGETRSVHAVLEGARPDLPAEAQDLQTGRINYLIGNDPKKWRTDIPTFGRVAFRGVYSGIDVVYHGSGGFLENDFVIQPGADPSAIRIRITGADAMRLAGDGSLAIEVGNRTLRWKAPYLYQRGPQGQFTKIEGRYRAPEDGVVAFEVGAYDVRRELVIDPVVTYATYLGGANAEGAARVAADASGNAYMIGTTDNVNFPVSPGAYFSSTSGLAGHVILAKVSPDGKSLLYETHIGGSSGNVGFGIAVDPTGNVYLTGMTASADYPIFPAGNNLTTKSITDPLNCFVTKLNAAGNALVYSTMIGGGQADGCGGIGLDSSGNAYVVGTTSSNDFPLVNAAQTQPPTASTGTPAMAFISKLNPDGNKLLYSTYLGGSGMNVATAVAVDSAGNAYFTGFTTSGGFPATQGAFQTTAGGTGGLNSMLGDALPPPAIFGYLITEAFGDAFVAKMSPSGQKIYATYLGGSKDDIGLSIAIDSKGNAYVGGATLSPNFPTQSAFQASYHGAGGNTQMSGGDGFIAEIDPAGAHLVFASYLGGSADDRVAGVALDSNGNIYLTGHTLSKDFPISGQAAQSTYGGDNNGQFPSGDAFLAEVDTTHTLVLSSYFGGSGGDWASGIAIDGTGGVIIAGSTTSSNFPATSGVFQSKFGGTDQTAIAVGDAFIARFGGSISPVSIGGISNAASFVGGSVAPGEAVLIAGTSIGPATLTTAQLDAAGKISTQVAGTQFTFNNVAAPIVFVSSQYSSVIVPYEVAGASSVQVVATYNGSQSPPFTVPVVAATPGVFSANASGTGQAAIFNQDLTHNSPQSPASLGSTVILFATGEGQTSPAGVTGLITSALIQPVLPVTVKFGGVIATSYAFTGETPGVVSGVLQINVTVPSNAPTGPNVPVVVMVGNTPSQSGLTIALQ